MSLATRARPISRVEYDRMVETGELGPDDRVELIEGQIVPKMPQNAPHSASVRKITRLMYGLFSNETISVQAPLALSYDSEPEPDIFVSRGDEENYRRRHPGPEDTILVVEVADSSLLGDRRRKVPMYLAAGVPEVWLVDLPNRRVLRYLGDPDAPEVYGEEDALPTEPPLPVAGLLH